MECNKYENELEKKSTGKMNTKKILIGLLIICVAVGSGYMAGRQNIDRGESNLIAKVREKLMGKLVPIKATDKVWCYLDADNELVISQEKITAPKDALVKEMHVKRPSRIVRDPALIHTVRFEGAVKPTSCTSWFYNCTSLKKVKNIKNLHTDKCVDMSWMFGYCQELTKVGDLSDWDISNVTNISYMFADCPKLKGVGDLSDWDTSSVTDMEGMFYNCSKLTDIGDLSEWDTSSVTEMSAMFYDCSSLTDIGDLSEWDTSNVMGVVGVFDGCSKLKSVGDLSKWDTASVIEGGAEFK